MVIRRGELWWASLPEPMGSPAGLNRSGGSLQYDPDRDGHGCCLDLEPESRAGAW
jgi:hypothetical protein